MLQVDSNLDYAQNTKNIGRHSAALRCTLFVWSATIQPHNADLKNRALIAPRFWKAEYFNTIFLMRSEKLDELGCTKVPWVGFTRISIGPAACIRHPNRTKILIYRYLEYRSWIQLCWLESKLFLLYRVVVGYALQSRVATMGRWPKKKIPQYWQSQCANPIVAPISSNTGTEINHGSVNQGYPGGSLPRVLADDVCALMRNRPYSRKDYIVHRRQSSYRVCRCYASQFELWKLRPSDQVAV
jgi:hypothetical protein